MFMVKSLSFCLFVLWHLNSAISYRIYSSIKTHLPIESKEYKDESLHSWTSDFTLANHYFVSDERLTWCEAQLACSNRGLNLIYPRNHYENVNLRLYMAMLYPSRDKYSGYWIGGLRTRDDDHFFWIDGRQVDDQGWLLGEPNGFLGENCIELKGDNSGAEMGWNNLYCDELRRYVCRAGTAGEFNKESGGPISQIEGSEIEKNKTNSQLRCVADVDKTTTSTTSKLTTTITSGTTARTTSTFKATTPIGSTSASVTTSTAETSRDISIEPDTVTTAVNPVSSSSQTPEPSPFFDYDYDFN